MKIKFITIKKRTLCAILMAFILICLCLGICITVDTTASPKLEYTIVIDAGHGGLDVKLVQYFYTV